MNTINRAFDHLAKVTRGLDCSAEVAIEQLKACREHLRASGEVLLRSGFSAEALEASLTNIRGSCKDFLAFKNSAVMTCSMDERLGLDEARRVLRNVLAGYREDGETMRAAQLTYLTDVLHIVIHRINTAHKAHTRSICN